MTLYTTKKCQVCGKQSELQLDPTKVQRWEDGVHVQNVWPEMSPEDRELLISGTHPHCWNQLMGPDPDEMSDTGGEYCHKCKTWNFYQEADVEVGMYWGFSCQCGQDTCHSGTYEDFKEAMQTPHPLPNSSKS